MIAQIMAFFVISGGFGQIIVNPHKKSRDFLYYFNTLRFPKRYCILFLYQYNGDKKREIKGPDGKMKNRGSDPAKEKARSAQNIGGQTNGSIL